MESRALLNLEVHKFEYETGKKLPNSMTLKWPKKLPTGASYDRNGFVTDLKGDGLVYQPVEILTDPPAPLNQLKSDNTSVAATIEAELSLHGLLAPAKIYSTFCDLYSPLLESSYFLKTYSQRNNGCDKCSRTNNLRIAVYYNENIKYFEINQAVSDLYDVDYCVEIPGPTTTFKPAPKQEPDSDFRLAGSINMHVLCFLKGHGSFGSLLVFTSKFWF